MTACQPPRWRSQHKTKSIQQGNEMSNTRKCWSADNERFNCETLGDLLDEDGELEPGRIVYVADAVPPTIRHLCDADDVLETIACRAHYMAGEYADDCASVGDEAKTELNTLLANWIEKHCSLNFWTVCNAKEYVLTEADFPAPEVVSNHQEMSGEQE
jgi:hypothetical protein